MSGRALGSALPEVPAVLSGTHFGRIWLVRLGALTAGWATCVPGWRPHGRRWSARLALLCIAVVAFTRSATTHAADGGDFTPLEMMDWLHLVAASVWIGCVCTASLTPPLAAERTDAALRLSRVSGITLGIALLTGAASGWWMVGGFGALVTTPYGRVLSIKLALVSVLVCIGAWNRFGLLRPLRRQLASSATVEGGDGGAAGLMRQLARSLLVEGFVMAGLLVVVAHLLQMRPPRP
jgi:putative copper resistance protein D